MQAQLNNTQKTVMIIGLIILTAVVIYALANGQISNLNNTYLG